MTVLLASAGLAACGSSPVHAKAKTSPRESPIAALSRCLQARGYAVDPESLENVETAPRRFEFLEVWNLEQSAHISFALTISKSVQGAAQALVWTRAENAKLDRGAVAAPVVRFGKVDVLWTAAPRHRDTALVYGCLRSPARAA